LWLWSAVWTKGMERSEVRTRVGTWERRLRGDGTGRDRGVLAAFLSWRAGLGPLLCPSGLHYAYDFSLVKQKPLQ
jgi:hypothetical protein